MNRSQLGTAVVVMILLTPTVAPTLAAVQTVFVGGGTPVGTQSGLDVKPANDGQYNLETPWKSNNELQLRGVTFRGSDAEITVDNFGDPNNGGEWTNVSGMSIDNSGAVYIDRGGTTEPVGAEGTATELRVRDVDLTEGGQTVDVEASASGDWSLIVNDTGLSQGTGVVAKNANTGEALDAAGVDADGNVRLVEMPAVTDAQINLVTGPSELLVFEEDSPNTLVSGPELRVRVFGGDEVIERQITNGRLDLTGVPSDQRLSITVKDADNSDYVYRRITVPSASEQGEVYLINATANAETSRVNFRINDDTGGQFPPGETRFIVQKPIKKDFDGDGGDETRYQNVAGDTIGQTGEFPTTLTTDERYRLKVANEQGDERLLGSYVVRGSDAPVVTIGRVVLSSEGDNGYASDLRTLQKDSDNDGTKEVFVRYAFRDVEDRTRNLDLTVTNETSGQTVISSSTNGPLGTYVQTEKVAESPDSATAYRANWTAERTQPNGTSKQIGGERFAGDVPAFAGEFPIDPRWLELIGFVSIVAIAGLVVIFDGALAALVSTGWASLLTIIGVVAIPAPALGLAGAVSVLAVFGRAR